MPSRFETASIDQLNDSFWSATSMYSLAHLQACWQKAIDWFAGLDFLTYKAETSTYLDSSSITAIGESTEEALYRDYVVDFDSEKELIARFRVCYRSSRNSSYKNTVVIECMLRFNGVSTSWTKMNYIDSNSNQYTNNRKLGSPYSIYLSADRKAFSFAQGFFLTAPNSANGIFPMASHGLLVEYDTATDSLYGSICLSTGSVNKYYNSVNWTSNDVAKNCAYRDFKISNNSLSAQIDVCLPSGSKRSAKQISNYHQYTYKKFLAIIEPGQTPAGFRLKVDGISQNFAPISIGFSAGTSQQRDRGVPTFNLTSDYWYYPIGSVCVYALIE